MNEFEDHVRQVAQQLEYPATPPVRQQQPRQHPPVMVGMRRLAVAIVATLVVVMVTPLRATILEFLQIGAVTIIPAQSTPELPTLPSLLNLFGETTLEDAAQRVGFALHLPDGFGPPDAVYQQSNSVITVWQANDARPALALYHLGPDEYLKVLSIAENTQVNGQPAIWTDVPHTLQYQQTNGKIAPEQTVLVEGNVLIWHAADITYRLESTLPMEEAIAIAETLR